MTESNPSTPGFDVEAYHRYLDNDPEVQARVRHIEWHEDTRTPYDGSCPDGCRAYSVAELRERLRRVLAEREAADDGK